jgi:hypothetical protein
VEKPKKNDSWCDKNCKMQKTASDPEKYNHMHQSLLSANTRILGKNCKMKKTASDPEKYKRLHQSLLSANGRLMRKYEKVQRRASFWRRQHVTLVNTIWRWTTDTPTDKTTLWVTMPKRTTEKRKAAAVGFSFPPDTLQPPKTPVKKKKVATSTTESTTPSRGAIQKGRSSNEQLQSVSKRSTISDSGRRTTRSLSKRLSFS